MPRTWTGADAASVSANLRISESLVTMASRFMGTRLSPDPPEPRARANRSTHRCDSLRRSAGLMRIWARAARGGTRVNAHRQACDRATWRIVARFCATSLHGVVPSRGRGRPVHLREGAQLELLRRLEYARLGLPLDAPSVRLEASGRPDR
jgi:hypothetical protein